MARNNGWVFGLLLGTLPAVIGLMVLPAAAAQLAVPAGFTAVGSACDAESDLPLCIRHEATGYELLYVAAGSFVMGSSTDDQDADEAEMPEETKYVAGFWIGRTEISNAQFRLFYPQHSSGRIYGHNLDQDSQPVVQVSWEDATAFCRWSGMRLPSEVEWEKAARGTDRRRYAWGNEMPPRRLVANFADSSAARYFSWVPAVKEYVDGFAATAPVGSFPAGASPCGALDMSGNVEEWCQDGWDRRMLDYISQVMDIPDGDVAIYRMYRGGSCFSGRLALRAARRESYPLDSREETLGFRAAISPAAPARPEKTARR